MLLRFRNQVYLNSFRMDKHRNVSELQAASVTFFFVGGVSIHFSTFQPF